MSATGAQATPPSTTGDPVYVQGSRRSELWAHFRSGAIVQVTRERERRYPGLQGSAPPTQSSYQHTAELGLRAAHVIDAGCGSGDGMRSLLGTFARVTGVDQDPRALAFAKQHVPKARCVQGDLQASYRTEPAQAAFLVDVVGHLTLPEQALRGLIQRLVAPHSVVLFEPVATARQTLVPPARRAYSQRSLHSLVTRAGLTVERWLPPSHDLVGCVAVPLRDPGASALENAERFVLRGHWAAAQEAALQVRRSSTAPLRIEGLLLEARIEFELGRRNASAAALLEAATLDARDARPVAGLARIAALGGDAPRAERLAREAVSLDPLEPTALCALADAVEYTSAQEAFEAWRLAHSLCPDVAGIARRLCETAIVVGDFAVAIQVLERLGRYGSTVNLAAHHAALAWLHAGSGQHDSADLEAKLAASLAPTDTAIHDLREFLRSVNPAP